jgi:transcriptional regulator with XRE-family HTH domain
MAVLDPAALRRRLRVELRRARTNAKLTQKEVADALDWSPSKLIRIESGQVAISVTDLRALLQHYGVKDKRLIDQLVDMARNSKRQPFSQYRDLFTAEALTLFGYEASASIIRHFEPFFVPGLAQTEDYMRAVFTDVQARSEAEIERLVAARLERQEVLDREEPPQAFFILGEAAVRQEVGGKAVMRRQLQHLESLNERSNITIQVLPFTTGAHLGMAGPFELLEFDDPSLDDLLYLESRTEYVTRDDVETTGKFLDTFWDFESRSTTKLEFSELAKSIVAGMSAPTAAAPAGA